MSYKPPVKETEYAKLSEHSKNEISPGAAWIVSEQSERDTLGFLKEASIPELKAVFKTVAEISDDGQGKFILFHAVKDGDPVQHTNSKLPNLHIHVFAKGFAEEFQHISDPETKSYVVRPNASLASAIKDEAQDVIADEQSFQRVTLSSENAEIQSHQILMNCRFDTFDDFVNNANERDWESLQKHLVSLIEPTVQEGQGGTRIVIDDRYTNTGALAIQVLAGENMDRSGENKQRYFQEPIM